VLSFTTSGEQSGRSSFINRSRRSVVVVVTEVVVISCRRRSSSSRRSSRIVARTAVVAAGSRFSVGSQVAPFVDNERDSQAFSLSNY
jgi:hypothetical protein